MKSIKFKRKIKISKIWTHQTELTKKEWPVIKFAKSILQEFKSRAWFKITKLKVYFIFEKKLKKFLHL